MIVITREFGQLGNRLLLSAHLIAAAQEYGVTLFNPAFSQYAHFFDTTASDLWCRYPVTSNDDEIVHTPSKWTRRATYKSVHLTARAMSQFRLTNFPAHVIRLRADQTCDLAGDRFKTMVSSKRPILVSGWLFRSQMLLVKHADIVRDHFQIIAEHQMRVDQLIASMRRDYDCIIGVHIRHGDYATYENGRYFYAIDKYVAAMNRIASQLNDRRVGFLVCSNSPVEPQTFGRLNVRLGTGHMVEDMYALAKTDYLIGPPSTFTGWASFYGKVPLQFMETADQAFDLSSFDQAINSRRAA